MTLLQYIKQTGSKVVECYGKASTQNKENQKIQARNLCYFTTMAYCLGFKNIRAFVVI